MVDICGKLEAKIIFFIYTGSCSLNQKCIDAVAQRVKDFFYLGSRYVPRGLYYLIMKKSTKRWGDGKSSHLKGITEKNILRL